MNRYAALDQSAKGVPTTPAPFDTGIASTMANARTSGNQLASYARAPQAFQLQQVPTIATGIGSAGQALSGFTDTLYSQRNTENNNALLREILKQRGGLGGSGLVDTGVWTV